MWKGKRPSLRHIKIWGYEVYVRRKAQDKLEARSEKCLFVGYPKESFGYLFYEPKDNVVYVARIGVFFKREMIFKEDKEKISDSTLSELDEPANYKEAMASPKAAKWKDAMKSEIQSMYDNQMDVKTAFLNEKLTGDLFMAQPEDKDDSRSQSGWIFLLNGRAVTWKSSKQYTVADSTCESAYIAACEASKEAIWMKNH
ncbi:retrotransposon protein, putative, ty1-copia subclass [Tanacetum coccineum]